MAEVETKAELQCPERIAETKHGRLPYSCTGISTKTMSAVRRHLTRPPHSRYLKLCPTCNEDILDQEVFESLHGTNGRLCPTPRAQRKGPVAQKEQWNILYGKIDALVISEGYTRGTLLSVTHE